MYGNRPESANAQLVEAAKAIDGGSVKHTLAVSYGCGSYTAVVLKECE